MAPVKIAALVDDLMDRSRLTGLGDVTFVRDFREIEPGSVDAVVVDLARHAEALADIRRAGPRVAIVAFGSHVDREALAQALDDGADAALPRSRFFADPLGEISDVVRGRNDGLDTT